MEANKERGVGIARGIRGCSLFFFIPIFSLAIGVETGRCYGVFWGIIVAMMMLGLSFYGVGKLVDRTRSGLTSIDCFLPVVISLISGVVFLPIGIVAGNLFSPATCIFSGILLTMGLLAYKTGTIQSASWLILPFLTFLYEILPIDLPTDLDNILGLSATTTIEVIAFFKGRRSLSNCSCDTPSQDGNDEVIDV
jgi:hypothetical protein